MTEELEILLKIRKLEEQAAKILKSKRKVLARRPIVIEFSGTPKSGKSSCITSLDIFLRRNSFRTKVLTERASVCPIENKFDPLFNVWNGCSAINQLAEIIANRPRDYDMIIMDRGFYDSLCWFEWQKMNGFIGVEDFGRFVNFFTSPRFRMMIDLIIHFDSVPQTSMEREYKNLLTRKEGSVMREHVLNGYREAAERVRQTYSKLFRQFEEVVTDNLGQNEVGAQVTELCLDKLRDVAREKICFVDRIGLEPLFGERDVQSFSAVHDYLNSNLKFADRHEVEQDYSKVQLIPIVLLKNKNTFSFAVGRKGKQATSNRSPEVGKILLYFGGHVRVEDKTLFDEADVTGIIHQCLFRELKEELGIDVKLNGDDPVCVWIRDKSRAEVHLAIAFVVERDLRYTKFIVDDREFVRLTKKDRYGTGASIDSAGMKAEYDKIDNWSKKVLEYKFPDIISWRPDPALDV
jgi:predicted NUDIX family phosphoesterase/thymidylate kinase